MFPCLLKILLDPYRKQIPLEIFIPDFSKSSLISFYRSVASISNCGICVQENFTCRISRQLIFRFAVLCEVIVGWLDRVDSLCVVGKNVTISTGISLDLFHLCRFLLSFASTLNFTFSTGPKSRLKKMRNLKRSNWII